MHASENDILNMSLEELMDIKVSVNSITAESLSKSPSTISVITAEQIKLYGFSSVSEAVESVAGFELMRTFSVNRLATARGILQDNYSNKILLTIDGTPVWSGITGFTVLDRISIQHIERIEVLKGPASVQYGTNAYVGVISLILKKQNQDSSILSVSAGVDDYYHLNFQQTFNFDQQKLYLAGHLEDETGQPYLFTDINEATVEFDDKEKIKNLTIKYEYANSQFNYNRFNLINSRLGISATATRGGGLTQVTEGQVLSYSYENKINNNNQILIRTSYDESGREFARTQDRSIEAHTLGKRYSATAKWLHSFDEKKLVELGLDFDKRKSAYYRNIDMLTGETRTENNMANRSVIEQAAFTRFKWSLERNTINLGFRLTDNELFGSNISASLSNLWELNATQNLRFNYAQSYRTPSLLELYFRTDSNSVIGNFNLEPETSDVIEIGYLYQGNSWQLNSTAYFARYQNKIFRNSQSYTLPDGTLIDNTSVYQNGNEITAFGLEGELKYSNSSGWNAFLNFDWVDGDNGDQVAESYNFKYSSAPNLSIGGSKSQGDWNVAMVAKFRGAANDLLGEISSSMTLDAVINYHQQFEGSYFLHTLSLKNITDDEPLVAEYVRKNGTEPLVLESEPRIYYQLLWNY